MTETAQSTGIRQIGRVIVPVSDQDRSLAFYTEKLGFEVRADIPYGDGDRWLEVAPPGAASGVAIVPPRAGEPVVTGGSCIAFETADIDALHADLSGAGVDVDPEVMRMGGPVPPMFFFRDPDGNSFLIVQRDS